MFGNTCVSILMVYNSQIAKLSAQFLVKTGDDFWKFEHVIIVHYIYPSLTLLGRECQ